MAISANSRRLIAIEATRGVAASAVIFYHAARHLHFAYGVPKFMDIFQFGHAGVDLFFVISAALSSCSYITTKLVALSAPDVTFGDNSVGSCPFIGWH